MIIFNYIHCMSREKNLNKILQFLYENDSSYYVADKISDAIKINLTGIEVLYELRFMDNENYLVRSLNPMVDERYMITPKGKEFYKSGGYVWEKAKKRIFQISSVIAFVIICWTFIIDFRGCVKQERKELKVIQKQSDSATLK